MGRTQARRTLVKKAVDGLAGVHIAFLEHSIDLILWIVDDLLEILNNDPRARWDR